MQGSFSPQRKSQNKLAHPCALNPCWGAGNGQNKLAHPCALNPCWGAGNRQNKLAHPCALNRCWGAGNKGFELHGKGPFCREDAFRNGGAFFSGAVFVVAAWCVHPQTKKHRAGGGGTTVSWCPPPRPQHPAPRGPHLEAVGGVIFFPHLVPVYLRVRWW